MLQEQLLNLEIQQLKHSIQVSKEKAQDRKMQLEFKIRSLNWKFINE